MSAAPAPISLDEHLSTEYEPDCDYVEGVLEERNVGKKRHSRTQTLLPDKEEVVHTPPLLWIEILSPEDRWNRVQKCLNDALNFGVPTVWIIDPYSKEAWIATPEHGTMQLEDGKLRCANPALEVALSEIVPED